MLFCASPAPVTAGTVTTSTINSCLQPVGSMDGLAIISPEGIGNSESGFHVVQGGAPTLHHLHLLDCNRPVPPSLAFLENRQLAELYRPRTPRAWRPWCVAASRGLRARCRAPYIRCVPYPKCVEDPMRVLRTRCHARPLHACLVTHRLSASRSLT
jgi:hypothetical protein